MLLTDGIGFCYMGFIKCSVLIYSVIPTHRLLVIRGFFLECFMVGLTLNSKGINFSFGNFSQRSIFVAKLNYKLYDVYTPVVGQHERLRENA